MIDPRPCDECRADVELSDACYLVIIDALTLEPEIEARLCPRCARAEFRRRRFGSIDECARDAARGVLERFFAEELRIIWLQQGLRRWALLCRRPRRRWSGSEAVGHSVRTSSP